MVEAQQFGINDNQIDFNKPHKLVEPYINNLEITEYLLRKKERKFNHQVKPT